MTRGAVVARVAWVVRLIRSAGRPDLASEKKSSDGKLPSGEPPFPVFRVLSVLFSPSSKKSTFHKPALVLFSRSYRE